MVAVTSRSLAPLVIGVAVAGVGQGVAYLGAQALLDGVVASDQRSSVLAAFFLVVYMAASASALSVGLVSGPLCHR